MLYPNTPLYRQVYDQIRQRMSAGVYARGGLDIDVEPLLFLSVCRPCFRRRVLARSRRGGGVHEVNRHRAGRALGAFRQRDGQLQHPLGPREPNLERRAQRIRTPGGAEDGAPTLTQQRVIQSHHQGLIRRQPRFDALPNGGEDRRRVDPMGRVESIVCRPVGALTAGGAKQARDGVLAQTNQLGQHVSPYAGLEAGLVAKRSGFLEDLVDGLDQGLGFFFTSPDAGGASGRRS